MIFQRLAVCCIVLGFPCAGWAQEAKEKNKGPLEFRFVAKRMTYPWEPAAKESPTARVASRVVLIAELKNTSKEPLEIVCAPGPELHLTGPTKTSVVQKNASTFYVAQVGKYTLPPGETLRFPLPALVFHRDREQYFVAWTEPGQYTLKAVFPLAVSPAPAGAPPAKIQMPFDGGKADGFGHVELTSPPIKFTVEKRNVVDYWTEALNDKDLDVRHAALQALVTQGPAAAPAAPTLVRLLQDPDKAIRLEAILALVATGDAGMKVAYPALSKALKDDELDVRAAAVKGLAQVGPREKETADLILPLLHDRYAVVRRAVLEALRLMPFERRYVEPKVTEALLNIVKEDPDSVVRRLAIAAMCHIPDPRVVRVLVPHMTSTDKYIRFEAMHTLARLGAFLDEKARAHKDDQGRPLEDAVKALIENLETPEFRQSAAYCLGQLGGEAAMAVPALLKALNAPEDQKDDSSIHHPRVLIVQAFRSIGPGAKAAVPDLVARLHGDPDWSVRQYAAEALGEIGPDALKAAPDLQTALKEDKMVQVRNNATRALVKLKAAKFLVECLEHENEESRIGVVIAVGEIRTKEVVAPLADRLAKDKSAKAREMAAWHIGYIGKDAAPAIPVLTKAMDDSEPLVRKAAVASLGQIGPAAKDTIPQILKIAHKDKEPATRVAAARSLYEIGMKGQKQSVPTLIDMLKDDKTDVPFFVLIMFSQMGPEAKAALPHVRALAKHPRLGDSARAALRKIEGN